MQTQLQEAVWRYTREHSNADGLALSPVPGLRMMCVDSPREKLQSTYRPLICLILQGSKHLLVGRQAVVCREGESVIVGADMPVTGQVVEASRDRPYIAIAVELDMPLLAELADQLRDNKPAPVSLAQTLFLQPTSQTILECGIRLMRLIGQPDAIHVLHPGLLRELHYWLLAGPHGAQLRAMASPQSSASRLGRAVALLRQDFRERIPVEKLAAAAAMSLTAFHRRFKELTSLTPGQYQKRLRLIEARRLMLYEGANATSAAFRVGYESVSQFTREYSRMFGAPPRQHSRATARVRALPVHDQDASAGTVKSGSVPKLASQRLA